jgi:hypothetical protein
MFQKNFLNASATVKKTMISHKNELFYPLADGIYPQINRWLASLCISVPLRCEKSYSSTCFAKSPVEKVERVGYSYRHFGSSVGGAGKYKCKKARFGRQF